MIAIDFTQSKYIHSNTDKAVNSKMRRLINYHAEEALRANF
jgi:hypothetical protein